jgi:hypothetical protein
MKIKWESNSRVKGLMAEGKIKPEDVIQKTQTLKFEPMTCTVRMSIPKAPRPSVTLHIRGKGRSLNGDPKWRMNHLAETCRVNFGGYHYNTTMNANGILDDCYTWEDVHNAVEKVKKVIN